MKSLGNVKGTLIAQSQLGSFSGTKVNMVHDANLAGSSNCCTGALEGCGSAVLQLGCEKCFLSKGDCRNNAVQRWYKNAKGRMLFQHLKDFPCLPSVSYSQITVLISKCELERQGNAEPVCVTV